MRLLAGKRIRLRVEPGIVVLQIQKAVRLIDVEVAAEPAHHDRSSATWTTRSARTSSSSCRRATERGIAFTLRALAKFLNPLLKILFAAIAKILAASLRSRDVHGFRGKIGSGATHGQARKIVRADARISVTVCSIAAESSEGVIDREALKAASHSGCGIRAIGLILLLLTRSQNEFRFHFARGIFRIDRDFLSKRGEAHELDFDDVAATRQRFEHEGTVHCRRYTEFLAGQRVGGRDGDSR